MIPLYGFLAGDTIGLLILAREDDRVSDLAVRLVQAARVRVVPKPTIRIVHAGRVLEPGWTLREAGISPLDRVDGVEERP